MSRHRLVGFVLLVFASVASAQGPATLPAQSRLLGGDDVVLMYAAKPDVCRAYGATFLAWGGAHTLDAVRTYRDLGVHPTGSMWCLTAGPRALHDNADLRDAVAKDIEGKPILVPWQFDNVHEGTPTWFGCTNHPSFRAHVRAEVARAMSGGADGLHVDDHLGAAHPSSWDGGCFCDFCMAAFREHLKMHGTPEMMKAAGVSSFDRFDYRILVRQHANTREQYLKVQDQIPLHTEFVNMQLNLAAENVRELGALAAEIVQHPVTLSANTGLPSLNHAVVTPYLTHLVGEVNHQVDEGTAGLLNAVRAYRMAQALNRPLAATASGHDWAMIKERNATNLVKVWIALGYACGQRLMVPHRQWCFTKEKGTHWYDGPTESFAPLYQFVRHNPVLFADTQTVGPLAAPASIPTTFDTPDKRQALKDALDAGSPTPLRAGETVWLFPRRGADGAAIVHVLNLNYDRDTDTIHPQQDLHIVLPADLYGTAFQNATVYAYDGQTSKIDVKSTADGVEMTLPELRIWSVIELR